MGAAQEDGSAAVPRRAGWFVGASVALATAMLVTSLWGTDDAFPLAPYRMFSYSNSRNGVVRVLRFEADLESGRRVRLDASSVGLRRAELEGQTPFGRRVPDRKLAAIARVYNERHDDDMVHLQVVSRGVRLRDGEPQPGEELIVLGDWADGRWDGPRAEVDLPLAEDVAGYHR
jgi:hypothetical protein